MFAGEPAEDEVRPLHGRSFQGNTIHADHAYEFPGQALRLIDDPQPPVANERIPVAEQAELIRFLNQIPPEYNPSLTRGVGSMYPINAIIRI